MKKPIEIEVDFIGGAGPLTKEEEKLISDFINSRKKKRVQRKRHASGASGKNAGAKTSKTGWLKTGR